MNRNSIVKMKRFLKHIEYPFKVDLRSLALIRILFSLLIITDLVIRSFFLEAHYADSGEFPIEALLKYSWKVSYFSLHILNGELLFQIFLFVINVIFALLLLIGFNTRLFTILCAVFLVSLHNRNPLLLQGGDTLFRCLMIWAIFIPWGNRFSVDYYLNKQNYTASNKVFSLGALIFMLQVALVYFASTFYKNSPEWKENLTAVYYALSLEQFRYLLGHISYKFPDFMKILTFFVWWVEYLALFILFFPYRNHIFRIIGIVLVISLQFGLFLNMRLGLFPWISMAGVLIFIPTEFWSKFSVLDKYFNKPFESIYKYFKHFPVINLGFFNNRKIIISVRTIISLILLFLLSYFAYWNYNDNRLKSLKVPEKYFLFTEFTRLDQKWNMFAPYPLKTTTWYSLKGTKISGEAVDIFRNGKEFTLDKPESIYRDYSNYRIRKLFSNLQEVKNRGYLKYYLNAKCRQWNTNNPENKITKIDFYVIKEKNDLNYEKHGPIIRKLYKYECIR